MSRMENLDIPSSLKEAPRDHSRLALVALAVIALVQVQFALTRTINWDEFFFYGQIVDFTQGESLRPLQTLHVQFFQWIPGIAPTGVDGIVIGRLFMLGCAFVSAGSVALIAGKFARREYALAAALVWLAAGFTMQHGWSFRTDPLATAPLAVALAVLARSRLSLGWIIAAGVLIGFAGMVTVKTILFLPAFAGLAWLRWSEAKFAPAFALRIAAIPLVATIAFASLYVWHGSVLGNADAATGASYAGGASQSMLFAGMPIYLHFAVKAAIISVAAVAAIGFALARLKSLPRDEMIAVAGLFAPLAALLIYRNTLPYFYPMMLAPVIAASVIGIAAIAQRYGLRLLIAYTALSGIVVWAVDGPSFMDEQREIQLAADAIFDEPVGYIDFPDMLPGHRKANGFLTAWGIEGVHERDEGYFRKLLEENAVPLLLTAEPEKNPTLLAIMQGLPQQARFRQDDREVLRATYRHFWGPFWLAGETVPAGKSARYEVLVPGPYTITSGSISVNGTRHDAGAIITLDRGTVALTNDGARQAGIIWGKALKAPDTLAPERPYWRGF